MFDKNGPHEPQSKTRLTDEYLRNVAYPRIPAPATARKRRDLIVVLCVFGYRSKVSFGKTVFARKATERAEKLLTKCDQMVDFHEPQTMPDAGLANNCKYASLRIFLTVFN